MDISKTYQLPTRATRRWPSGAAARAACGCRALRWVSGHSPLYDTADYGTMKALCCTAFDHGITYFDLANNYGPAYGSAERNFGQLMDNLFRP